MLRADILDAVDYRMRSVKRNYKVPFGGVQVLLIGDLYQLPPVVKDQEWTVLSRFYKSMHFFEAKALQNSGMVYLELDKIFRQQDDVFIRILNNLRDNRATAEDVRVLNQHFRTQDEIRDLPPCITLTTHNYKADELNLRELRSLDSPSFFYDADVERVSCLSKMILRDYPPISTGSLLPLKNWNQIGFWWKWMIPMRSTFLKKNFGKTKSTG
jgi:hypothetical protein